MKNEKDPQLSEVIAAVEQFHKSFRVPVRYEPFGDLNEQEFMLRFNLMKEENEEYLEAARRGDLVEIADAIGDMLYILCGTINAHGLQDRMGEIFAEIQRSNMSKLDENGEPIFREDGKVMKSDRYFRPNIAQYLK